MEWVVHHFSTSPDRSDNVKKPYDHDAASVVTFQVIGFGSAADTRDKLVGVLWFTCSSCYILILEAIVSGVSGDGGV